MKVRLFDIKDVDELIFRLSGLGIDLGETYKQLEAGKTDSLEISMTPAQLDRIKPALADLCRYKVVSLAENTKAIPMLTLGILWIDSMLLYFLLKFSFLSQDFTNFLTAIFGYGKLVGLVKNAVSLLTIAVYYSGFILVKNTTPVGRLLSASIERDHKYFIVLFSLPLIAFKLLLFDQKLVKSLGLLILSLCLVLPFYLRGSVKYS